MMSFANTSHGFWRKEEYTQKNRQSWVVSYFKTMLSFSPMNPGLCQVVSMNPLLECQPLAKKWWAVRF